MHSTFSEAKSTEKYHIKDIKIKKTLVRQAETRILNYINHTCQTSSGCIRERILKKTVTCK